MKLIPTTLSTIFVATMTMTSNLQASDNPFVGRWALTIPGGGAGWLGIEKTDKGFSGSILWGGGSVTPVNSTNIADDKLVVIRHHPKKVKDSSGTERTETTTETITATTDGDNLNLVTEKADTNGKKFGRAQFSGKRIKPMPPQPDLNKVKFGDPVQILNGKDLGGWRLINPKDKNGWKVENGVLSNRVVKGEHYGNIRTDAEFEDFNLNLEVRTMSQSNSGIYLRGIYEVQIAETCGKPLDSHNMGALYSRITPSVAAEKPINEWQTMNITLVDRHLTVILNGKTIIDNQPVLGCTGGALTSDEFKPGPIYLQGDHTDIDLRNIVLRPVVK